MFFSEDKPWEAHQIVVKSIILLDVFEFVEFTTLKVFFYKETIHLFLKSSHIDEKMHAWNSPQSREIHKI